MKYKVGDYVRIKTKEEIEKTLSQDSKSKEGLSFNIDMYSYCGEVFPIEMVQEKGLDSHYSGYKLMGCRGSVQWLWVEEWLEPIERFKVGDLVSINPELKEGQVIDNHTVYYNMMADKNPPILKIIEVRATNIYKLSNGYYYPEEMLLKEYEIKITESPHKEQFNALKNKIYEHQLQREKARVRGAEIPTGRRICCRKCKAAVIIGHLSNQARAGY